MTAPDVDICDVLDRAARDGYNMYKSDCARAAAELRQTRKELSAARKLLEDWAYNRGSWVDTRTFLVTHRFASPPIEPIERVPWVCDGTCTGAEFGECSHTHGRLRRTFAAPVNQKTSGGVTAPSRKDKRVPAPAGGGPEEPALSTQPDFAAMGRQLVAEWRAAWPRATFVPSSSDFAAEFMRRHWPKAPPAPVERDDRRDYAHLAQRLIHECGIDVGAPTISKIGSWLRSTFAAPVALSSETALLLFAGIEHGDAEHRAWLKAALLEFAETGKVTRNRPKPGAAPVAFDVEAFAVAERQACWEIARAVGNAAAVEEDHGVAIGADRIANAIRARTTEIDKLEPVLAKLTKKEAECTCVDSRPMTQFRCHVHGKPGAP